MARKTEKTTINNLLADQNNQLGALNTAIGDLTSYTNDAVNQYISYSVAISLSTKEDDSHAQTAYYAVEQWEDDIDAFLADSSSAGSYVNQLSSDQTTFESMLQAIIDRNK
jgi:hypothetical protein